MPWGRLDDQANGNAKLLALTDAAWRMWGCGLIYCQANLTDGFIPKHAIESFGVRARNKGAVANELCQALVPGKAPLWHVTDGGYTVHDYLQWNDSRDDVLAERASAKARMVLVRDPKMRKAIKERDGDTCRYCGCTVNWYDRKGIQGATYDHVNPKGGDTLDNLVICCRRCNTQKGQRTPETAGMALRESRPDLDLFKTELSIGSSTRSSTHVPLPQPLDSQTEERLSADTNARKAHPIRDLLNFYSDSYASVIGAKPHIKHGKDAGIISGLLGQFDDVTIRGALSAFIADDYAKRAGFPLQLFVSQFNKYLASSVKAQPAGDWYGHVPHCATKAACTERILREEREKKSAAVSA